MAKVKAIAPFIRLSVDKYINLGTVIDDFNADEVTRGLEAGVIEVIEADEVKGETPKQTAAKTSKK